MRISRYFRRMVIATAVATVAAVLALDGLHALRGVDQATIDARFAIRGSQGAPAKVIVVGIDAATFNYLDEHHPREAHFPFARRLDARVIHNLVGDHAKVIAYDEQFTEQTDPADDNALILAVRAAHNLVLATTEVAPGGKTRIFGGAQGLKFSRATPADSQFPVDSDGKVRRMHGTILGLVTFPVAAAERAVGRGVELPRGHNSIPFIDFRGPSGTVPTVPYWQVLEGKFAPGTFRGKVVVVGATESILHDQFPTSVDTEMPGPEVQANAIDTVIRGFPLRLAPDWLNLALVILLGIVAPLVALRRDGVRGAVAALGALLLLAVACQLAFNGGTIVGFVYPALAALVSVAAVLVLQGLRIAFEREQVRETFARFVPESVVDEALAQANGLRLGGVERDATVLFSDLRGFTSFAENRTPEETIDVLNRYLTLMSDAILEHGGTLVSYMGDGIMAVFGAPIEQPDHAQRALDAARSMLDRLEEFNSWLRTESRGDGFKMGIGLNSGNVMSGNVGSERRLEYTTIGDTTNTASRLEGMTKGTPHQLYIAGTTYVGLANPPDDLVSVGEVDVRGRTSRITIWTLADAAAGETS
jgi:adenylate cyclase